MKKLVLSVIQLVFSKELKTVEEIQESFSYSKIKPSFSHNNVRWNFRILSKQKPAVSSNQRNSQSILRSGLDGDIFVQVPGENCGTNLITDETQSRSDFYRIVGGFTATQGQFPWQAFFYPCTANWGCYRRFVRFFNARLVFISEN